jgi:hypothetical protein
MSVTLTFPPDDGPKVQSGGRKKRPSRIGRANTQVALPLRSLKAAKIRKTFGLPNAYDIVLETSVDGVAEYIFLDGDQGPSQEEEERLFKGRTTACNLLLDLRFLVPNLLEHKPGTLKAVH